MRSRVPYFLTPKAIHCKHKASRESMRLSGTVHQTDPLWRQKIAQADQPNGIAKSQHSPLFPAEISAKIGASSNMRRGQESRYHTQHVPRTDSSSASSEGFQVKQSVSPHQSNKPNAPSDIELLMPIIQEKDDQILCLNLEIEELRQIVTTLQSHQKSADIDRMKVSLQRSEHVTSMLRKEVDVLTQQLSHSRITSDKTLSDRDVDAAVNKAVDFMVLLKKGALQENNGSCQSAADKIKKQLGEEKFVTVRSVLCSDYESTQTSDEEVAELQNKIDELNLLLDKAACENSRRTQEWGNDLEVLRASLHTEEEQNAKLKLEMIKLNDQLKDVTSSTSSNEDSDAELSFRQLALKKITQENEMLRGGLMALREKFEELSRQGEDTALRHEQALAGAKLSVVMAQNKNSSLQSEINCLNSQLFKMEAANESLVAKQTEVAENLKLALIKKEEEKDAILNEATILREKATAHAKQVAGLNKRIDTLQSRCKMIESKTGQGAPVEVTRNQPIEGEMERKIEDLRLELDKARGDKLEAELEMMNQIGHIESLKSSMKSGYEKTLAGKESYILELQRALINKDEQIVSMQRQLDQMLDTIKSRSVSHREEVEEMQSEILKISNKCASLDRALSSAKSQIDKDQRQHQEELNQEHEKFRRGYPLSERDQNMQALNASYKTAVAENEQLKVRVKALTLEVEKQRLKLTDVTEMSSSDGALKVIKSRNEKLKSEVEMLRRRLKKAEEATGSAAF